MVDDPHVYLGNIMLLIVGGNDTVVDRPEAFLHRCMGNRMAEMQLRVVWEEILKRFHKVEIFGEPVRARSNFVRGITHLPVRVTPV
jgi:hypothetical protein